MMGRGHISADRLTALAFVARAPEQVLAGHPDDIRALEHVAGCDACAERLAQFTLEADAMRDVASAQADAVFDDARLDTQRARILDRLAHLGQTARVITFPRRSREAAMPVSPTGRRWVSVAAAAGLIIGLVAGQLLHFLPSAPRLLRDEPAALQVIDRSPAVGVVPASVSLPMLSDDELMEEIETAVQLRRAKSLRAIDGLTPTAADLLAMGR